MKQKYHHNDLVQVKEDIQVGTGRLNKMWHPGEFAIVEYSYDEKYGGNRLNNEDFDEFEKTFRGTEEHDYSIWIYDNGSCAWFDEDALILIEENRPDILKAWKEERKEQKNIRSNLDWIFANGDEVLKTMPGDSVAALGKCLGIDNMWGSRGEGMTLLMNTMSVMQAAGPFLLLGKKDIWLKFCKDYKDGAKLDVKLT